LSDTPEPQQKTLQTCPIRRSFESEAEMFAIPSSMHNAGTRRPNGF
jgi:hypothetical protein